MVNVKTRTNSRYEQNYGCNLFLYDFLHEGHCEKHLLCSVMLLKGHKKHCVMNKNSLGVWIHLTYHKTKVSEYNYEGHDVQYRKHLVSQFLKPDL